MWQSAPAVRLGSILSDNIFVLQMGVSPQQQPPVLILEQLNGGTAASAAQLHETVRTIPQSVVQPQAMFPSATGSTSMQVYSKYWVCLTSTKRQVLRSISLRSVLR